MLFLFGNLYKDKPIKQKDGVMKKIVIMHILSLIIGLGTSYKAEADFDADRLFKNLVVLANGLTTIVDTTQEVINNSITLKMFASCIKVKDKQTAVIIDPKDPNRRVACKNTDIPLNAIQSFLNLIKNRIIGSKATPGIVYALLDLLSLAGLEQQISPIQARMQEVAQDMAAVSQLINDLKLNIAVA
jgi:hypothetical protein